MKELEEPEMNKIEEIDNGQKNLLRLMRDVISLDKRLRILEKEKVNWKKDCSKLRNKFIQEMKKLRDYIICMRVVKTLKK